MRRVWQRVVETRRFFGSMCSLSMLPDWELRFFDRLGFEIHPEL